MRRLCCQLRWQSRCDRAALITEHASKIDTNFAALAAVRSPTQIQPGKLAEWRSFDDLLAAIHRA